MLLPRRARSNQETRMSNATSFQPIRLRNVALAIVIFVGATAPSLAIDHTYYLDLDQDSYGDPNNTMTVPTNWLPNRLLTQRAGDPDDTTQAIYGVPVDKGQRRFGLELSDSADSGAWNGPLLDELAADAVTWEMRWNQLESAPGEYAGPEAAVLSAVGPNLPGTGLALNLTVSAISGTKLTLPADLLAAINAGTLRMNDDAVVDRYKALLDRVHTELGSAALVSLQIGHEVDLMFPVRPDINFWVDFQVFYYLVTQHAKSLWGSTLKVGLTATHIGLTDTPQRWLMEYLNSTSDIIALTYFPHNANFTVPDPTTLDIGGMFQSILNSNGSKPIYVQATAYPTLEGALGTQMKQSQFMYAFFEAWDQHAALIPFVSFFRLHDPDVTAVQRIILGSGLDAQNSSLISNLFSLGLRERAGDGKHKPAYDSLRNLAFERGWWREPVRTTRPYLMGFTPELYDFPPDAAGTAIVEDYIFDKLQTMGDIVNLHMDGGIPWPEAFADDFSSANAPYSNALIATWYALLNRVPPVNKLLVSINPLGIPRRTLAPYWGYGEQFQYQQGPPWGRIPTGDFSDGAPRIPPAPWDSYGLGDEPVKTAFLNYARRTVEFFNPDYLMIGIEVSATQVEDEAAWQDFVSLHRFVYTELKNLYPNLPVFLSFSATSYMTDELYPLAHAFNPNMEQGHTWKYDEMEPGVRERLKQGLRDVLDYTDIIALSVYPHFGKYNAYQMPASMWSPLFDLLQEIGAGDRPIAVSESGYSADPFSIVISEEYDPYVFTGSAEKQDRYLKLMLYELNKASNPVEFIINYQVRDGDLWWQRLFSTGDDIFNQFYQYFKDIGIFAGDGSDRPATIRWTDEFALSHVPASTP
jgi:hypothetical protein